MHLRTSWQSQYNVPLMWPTNQDHSWSHWTHATPTKPETILLSTAGLAGSWRPCRGLPNPLPSWLQSLYTPILDFLVTCCCPWVWPVLPQHALVISLSDLHLRLCCLSGSTDIQCLRNSKSKIGFVSCQPMDHQCPNCQLLKQIGNIWSFCPWHSSALMQSFIHITLSLVHTLKLFRFGFRPFHILLLLSLYVYFIGSPPSRMISASVLFYFISVPFISTPISSHCLACETQSRHYCILWPRFYLSISDQFHYHLHI